MNNIETLYNLLEEKGSDSPEIIGNCILGEIQNDIIIIKPNNEKLQAVALDMTIDSFKKMYGAYRHNENHKKEPADFAYDYCRDFKSKHLDIWDNRLSSSDILEKIQ